MPIYEKTVKELMHEFAAQELKPGQSVHSTRCSSLVCRALSED